MNKLAGPLVGLSVIALIAMGVYLYTVRGELSQAQAVVAAAQTERGGLAQQVRDLTQKLNETANAVTACVNQLNDAQAQIAELQKPPSARRRPATSTTPTAPAGH